MSWYQSWHNNKHHPHIHWGSLIAICLLAGNWHSQLYRFLHYERKLAKKLLDKV